MFGKVQGAKCNNMASWYFPEYSKLFFFMKSHGKGPWTGGPGPHAQLMGG
jgi:hypothetical protein